MELVLNRLRTGPNGTFGVLIQNDIPFMVTLEDPWADNAEGKSCIPNGVYKCVRVKSDMVSKIFKGDQQETFEVTGVTARSLIRIHPGNTIYDTQGCILTGMSFGLIGERPSIKDSKVAFLQFMDRMKGIDEFKLSVLFV